MKVWTVILAGVLLAALPNLGDSALEDAGVVVSYDYTEFEMRVMPAKTALICTHEGYEWFQINKFEQSLMDFENGNNTMKATFLLGTPAMLLTMVAKDAFLYPIYCKYLPKAFHEATTLRNEKTSMVMMGTPLEYYAVKISDTEQATITKGWNDLHTVVMDRFPNYVRKTYEIMIVEKTAAGVIYVGSVQNYQ